MSGSFETVCYTESAMKKADQLLLEAFLLKTGAQPNPRSYPFWLNRKVVWEVIPDDRANQERKNYTVEIVGRVVIYTDEKTMQAPWPYWEQKVRIRLIMVPARRSRSWFCKKAVGLLENKTMIRYSYDKEIILRRKAAGLPT